MRWLRNTFFPGLQDKFDKQSEKREYPIVLTDLDREYFYALDDICGKQRKILGRALHIMGEDLMMWTM